MVNYNPFVTGGLSQPQWQTILRPFLSSAEDADILAISSCNSNECLPASLQKKTSCTARDTSYITFTRYQFMGYLWWTRWIDIEETHIPVVKQRRCRKPTICQEKEWNHWVSTSRLVYPRLIQSCSLGWSHFYSPSCTQAKQISVTTWWGHNKHQKAKPPVNQVRITITEWQLDFGFWQ